MCGTRPPDDALGGVTEIGDTEFLSEEVVDKSSSALLFRLESFDGIHRGRPVGRQVASGRRRSKHAERDRGIG